MNTTKLTRKAKLYQVTQRDKFTIQGIGWAYVVGTSKREAIETANLKTAGLPKAKILCEVTVSNGPQWEESYDLDLCLHVQHPQFLPENWKAHIQIGNDLFSYFLNKVGEYA
tara:strand:+ start:249 stop:584 length:336 start_codon:yes stop_codon:yes gene_type:complete